RHNPSLIARLAGRYPSSNILLTSPSGIRTARPILMLAILPPLVHIRIVTAFNPNRFATCSYVNNSPYSIVLLYNTARIPLTSPYTGPLHALIQVPLPAGLLAYVIA